MVSGVIAPKPLLAAQGISKRYGVIQALDSVDLEVLPGEILGLAGENGSGKSTLARILAGVVQADDGTVMLRGTGYAKGFSRPLEALDAGVALVSQELTPVPNMSIGENVFLTALHRPLSLFRQSEVNARARPLLRLVGVRANPGAPFSSLKTGNRELVEVARALASEPSLLILDETTSRLGEEDVQRLFVVIRNLRNQGTSTIFITHRLSEFGKIADRVVVLRDGRYVGHLDRSEIAETRLSALMVGRQLQDFSRVHHPERSQVVLRAKDVTRDGGRATVSLAVRAGEIVGLAGLVGSGRTELLEAIAGMRRRYKGSVTVGHTEVLSNSTRSAIRAGLVLVPEERIRQGLVMSASIRRNIAMPMWRAHQLASEERERVMAGSVVDKLRIRAKSVDSLVSFLSGGNQQKVLLGRWMALRPRPLVLLLDEPTRGVDVGARQEIYRIINELVGDGMGVLMAGSELRELLELCDRVLVMHEDQIVADLPRSEASEERIMFLSGGGRFP